MKSALTVGFDGPRLLVEGVKWGEPGCTNAHTGAAYMKPRERYFVYRGRIGMRTADRYGVIRAHKHWSDTDVAYFDQLVGDRIAELRADLTVERQRAPHWGDCLCEFDVTADEVVAIRRRMYERALASVEYIEPRLERQLHRNPI